MVEEKGFTFVDVPQDPSVDTEAGFQFVEPQEPKRIPLSERAEDVGRSVVSKGAQGVAGTLIGGPGSVETFFFKDVPEIGKSIYTSAKEKLDMISPAEAEAERAKPFYEKETEAQKKGLQSPLLGLPTYKRVVKEIQEKAPEYGAPMLAYEPKTTEGKVIGAGAEMAAQGIPGGVRKLAGRMITGFGAGSGSEAFGLYTEGQPNEAWARLSGAIGGGLLLGNVSNAIRSTFLKSGAEDSIADALAKDFARGQSPFTPKQLEEMAKSGTIVTVYDMAGPETKKVLARYAEMTGQNTEATKKFNQFLNERSRATSERVSSYMTNMFGKQLDAAALEEAVEAAGKNTRDIVYGIARANPAANSIPSSLIGKDLLDSPAIQKAMRETNETAKNRPDWNIVVPKVTKEIPPTPSSILDEYGKPVMTPGKPAEEISGNLSFWHNVKTRIDNEIGAAERAGRKQDVAELMGVKDQLVKKIESVVSEYKTARDVASETFKAGTAPQAGYNFVTMANQFKKKEIVDALQKYTPEQKEYFAEGVASRINQMIESGKIAGLAKSFSNDKNFQDRMKLALGDERYNAISGKVISENLIRQADELNFVKGGVSAKEAGVAGGALVAAAEMVANLIQGANAISPELASKAFVAGTAVSGTKMVLNSAEKAAANKALPLAFSKDPKDIQKLGELASTYPVINQLFNKISTTMSVAITQQEKLADKREERTQRKAGGRVSIDHEREAERLIDAAEKAKQNHQKSTERLLDEHDNAIAKALQVAKRQI